MLDWSAARSDTINSNNIRDTEHRVLYKHEVLLHPLQMLFDRSSTLLAVSECGTFCVVSLPLGKKVLERKYEENTDVRVSIIEEEEEDYTSTDASVSARSSITLLVTITDLWRSEVPPVFETYRV